MDHLHILFNEKRGQSRDLSDEVDVRVMAVAGMNAVEVLQVAVDGGGVNVWFPRRPFWDLSFRGWPFGTMVVLWEIPEPKSCKLPL